MLIGSHILEDGSAHECSDRFAEAKHMVHANQIAERLALLLNHQELWKNCSLLTSSE